MGIKFANSNYEDMPEGGVQVFDDVDVKVVDAWFALREGFDKSKPAAPHMFLSLVPVENQDVDPSNQWFSAGNPDFWKPTDGQQVFEAVDQRGTGLAAVGSQEAISRTSNVGKLIKSFVDAGYGATSGICVDCTELVGLEFHIIQKATGDSWTNAKGESVKSKDTLCDKIINMPGDASEPATPAKAEKPKRRRTKKAAPVEIDASAVENLAEGAITEALKAAGEEGVVGSALSGMVQAKGVSEGLPPNVTMAAMEMATTAEFLQKGVDSKWWVVEDGIYFSE